jgi:hypothetical protein
MGTKKRYGDGIARSWYGRVTWMSGFVLAAVAFSASASAAGGRSDYDLDDDGLIEIDDLDDLDEIRNDPTGSSLYGSSAGCPAGGCAGYELTTDLDFDTNADGTVDANDDHYTVLGDYEGWVPIESLLTATFEGNDHVIRNLTILGAVDTALPHGLFGNIGASLAQNVRFENVNFFDFPSDTGVLAGQVYESSVHNVSVVGGRMQVNGSGWVGGLIGDCVWTQVAESYTSLHVRASDWVGGLIGQADGCYLERVFAHGRTTSDRYHGYLGGLVGYMIDGTIKDAFFSGSVGEASNFGGLVGITEGTPVFENTFVSGAVVGTGEAGGGMLGFGPGTFTSSFFATDTTGYEKTRTAGGGATAVTLDDLRCSDAPNDSDCLPGLFADWEDSLNSDGQPAWDFGSDDQVPALRIRGVVLRDSDGDGVLDEDDDFPSYWEASVDSDGDGAIDYFREGCGEACQAASSVVLDQFPGNPAAAVDLDLDGQPDSWNPGCDATCQSGSGLTLDARPNDLDDDGLDDDEDLDDDGDGIPDVDLDSDGLIDITALELLDRVRFDPTGISLRTNWLSDFGDVEDNSGCRPRVVGPVLLFYGEFLFEGGVLTRFCNGYELLADLDFDTSGDGVISDADDYWNEGRGWEPLGHLGDDPRAAFQTNFEGHDHVIDNLFIDTGLNEVGLFGGVRGANIRNLGVSGSVTTTGNGSTAGGLVAQMVTTTVSGCYSTGSVTSTDPSIGGLIGRASGSTVVGSFSTADVLSHDASCGEFGCDSGGGLVGLLDLDSSVAASFASGSIVADSGIVGGLVGHVRTGSVVSGSFATSFVDGVTSPFGGVGGLIGLAENDVEASYWATDSSTQSTSAGNAQGATSSELACPTGPNDGACKSGAVLFADWGEILDPDGLPYWDFGTSSELPGLCLAGSLYRVDSAGVLLPVSPCHCPEVETELVTNTGFETNTSGWTGSYGTSISSSTLRAHSGARSLRIANRNIAAWQGAEYNLLGKVVPGETLEASLWARISGASSDQVLFTLRTVCQGSPTDYINVATGTATNSGWVKLTGTFEAPTCTLSELGIYAEGPAPGVVLYIDDVSIVRSTAVCPGDQAPLSGQILVTDDWGTGYCVEVRVTNSTSLTTSTWFATLNLQGATINQIWNLSASSTTGSPTLTPIAWAAELDPGESTHSLGFCANRPSGSSALPSGLAVTGTF